MRKLFVSFTGVMYAIKQGRVNEGDLANGLFIFGCTRGHAITPGAAGEYIESVVSECPEVHKQLVEAITAAEADGRIRWRTLEQHTNFEMVEDLLAANGEPPLISHAQAYGREDSFPHYNYPSVQDRCKSCTVVF